ncbi:DUF423 domain-containing protein [Guyparkeria halophila]|uniref:DUF423 domain-containing protein n=1 Tax=Guyparkeria halophila TaxID=47960 RepID=A0ABZ0YVP9_9GAMM|nr:DUF423 domain-containing protein [Guyparkeria halophila]WQH15281.1 DUF423 domain-containing protein [Guyparkeria halophila]
MPQTIGHQAPVADRPVLAIGLANGLVAVVLAALAAHGPMAPTDLDAQRQVDTAILLHFVHTLAIMLLAYWPAPGRWRLTLALAWLVGIILFSGSLYALTLFNQPWPGAITPIGGLFLMLGWIGWLGGLLVVKRPDSD